MGRNRKNLGGGKWGEAMLETILNAHSQQQRHNGGGKYGKQKNWEKNLPSFSRPSSTSPSPYQARNKGLKYKGKDGRDGRESPPLYEPRTANQALYLKYLSDKRIPIVLGVGPAGCGKTLFACHRAIEEWMEGNIKKIVITRPMVSVEDESVGFLPGDMTQKMAPWTRPIFDIFHEYFDPLDVQDMIRRGVVEISPLAYMRGRTFKDAFIIADEMQNSTPNQMLMLTTRLGENAKMAITGDLKQSDKGLENNGLADFMRKLYAYRRARIGQEGGSGGILGVKLVQLCSSDICRSDIVTRVLDMYEMVSDAPSLSHGHSEIGSGWVSDSDFGEDMRTESPVKSDREEAAAEAVSGAEEEEEGAVKKISYPYEGGNSRNKHHVVVPHYKKVAEKKKAKWETRASPQYYHQPKPKRHQVGILDEPEYQEHFEKNLKKVIENVLNEQTPSKCMDTNTDTDTDTDMEKVLVIDTDFTDITLHDSSSSPEISTPQPPPTTPDTPETPTVTESEIFSHGSADCALISKRDHERGKFSP